MPIVPTWQPAGRLMYFPQLTTSGTLLPVFTVGWRIEDAPDVWTQRFLRFKASNADDLMGAARVLHAAVSELLKGQGLAAAETGLTTALSSRNTCADAKSPLYKVGQAISQKVGLVWLPAAFSKAVHRPLHTIMSGDDRDLEVADKYTCGQLQGVRSLIILDDFVTRGATFADMVRAMKVTNANVQPIGLALAKNERASFAQNYGVAVDNHHIPQEWDALWTKGKS